MRPELAVARPTAVESHVSRTEPAPISDVRGSPAQVTVRNIHPGLDADGGRVTARPFRRFADRQQRLRHFRPRRSECHPPVRQLPYPAESPWVSFGPQPDRDRALDWQRRDTRPIHAVVLPGETNRGVSPQGAHHFDLLGDPAAAASETW